MICFIAFTCFCNCNCKTSKANDSVTIAGNKNEAQPSVNKEVAAFLVKIADARMMGKKEGELAVQKGTTAEITSYGKLMINDQELLLAKIKALAAARNITLPAAISNDKKDGFKDLDAKSEKNFDHKFIKMMRIDHERDIKDFTKATELADKGIADFAVKYLPMIQAHLDKLNAIKE